jgi:protein PhnA
MPLPQASELTAFLSSYISEGDQEQDDQTTRNFAASAPADRRDRVAAQLKTWIDIPDLPLDELGTVTNRWFAEQDEAREWMQQILNALQASGGAETSVVKDSNGTPLQEGDSVTVIKDLKVKGGSSDLKRGTMIRKIHLVDDPEVVECRVDGSTLVLKTCFLKKA